MAKWSKETKLAFREKMRTRRAERKSLPEVQPTPVPVVVESKEAKPVASTVKEVIQQQEAQAVNPFVKKEAEVLTEAEAKEAAAKARKRFDNDNLFGNAPVVGKTTISNTVINPPEEKPQKVVVGAKWNPNSFPNPLQCVQQHGLGAILDAAAPMVGRNLCLCLPFFKTTNPMTMVAISSFLLDFGREKIQMRWAFGDSMVENARNRCADRFLESGAEWSLWIDDDVIPPFGRAGILREECGLSENEKDPYFWPDHLAGAHGATRLMSHGLKLIGGTYFGRRRKSPVMFQKGMVDKYSYELAKAGSGDVIATDWVGTGFILIHRDVFTDIQAKFPELAPNEYNEFFAYFAKNVGMGEDMSFCKRAKEAGHQPYVDTGVQCLHLGYMAYGFHNTEAEKKKDINAQNDLFS